MGETTEDLAQRVNGLQTIVAWLTAQIIDHGLVDGDWVMGELSDIEQKLMLREAPPPTTAAFGRLLQTLSETMGLDDPNATLRDRLRSS